MVSQPHCCWAGADCIHSAGRAVLPLKNCRKYNSICDFAEANLEDLLPSLEVPLRAGYGHCISADTAAPFTWGRPFLGTAGCPGVFVLPHQALYLPVPKHSTKTDSLVPRKVLLSVPPKMLLPSGWPGQDGQGCRWGNGAGGGKGQGNGQTLIEIFQTPRFLLFFTEEFWHTCPSDYDQSQE